MSTAYPNSRQPTIPLVFRFVRELDQSDLSAPPAASPRPLLRRLRDVHHNVARLIASGQYKQVEIAAIVGMTPERITMLQGDPSFRELVEFYRQSRDKVYLDVHQRLKALVVEATAELQERLVESPEAISTTTLLEIAKFGADRAGYGPEQKYRHSLSVLTAGDIERIKLEARAKQNGQIQRVERLPGGPGADLGGAFGRADVSEGEIVEGTAERVDVREEGGETAAA